MMNNNLVFTPIRQLGRLLKTREISPVELTELSLDRLSNLGPKYNAIVTITAERALNEARRAEKQILEGTYLGPLHGIPYGAKDLLATSGGIPTTWGAAPLRNQTFDEDATVIKKLGDAGAILVAKLAMVELAGGMGYRHPNASFTGPGLCPWDTSRWTGGSSSGSGAAVAAGLVPLALGSETWGSILGPANNCGVAGLRPTYGRVSRAGAMALSWTMDKIGPMALTADDCGIALEAISGSDPKDGSSSPKSYKYTRSRSKSRFKLAVIRDVAKEAQEDVRENFNRALRDLSSVSEIHEIDLPDLPYEAMSRTIISAEGASALEELIDSGQAKELTNPSSRIGLYSRMFIPAVDYLKALRIRRLAVKALEECMEPFDALIAPSRSTTATPVDQDFRTATSFGSDIMGGVGNGLGLPAISVPNGFDQDGLPTGIQFMGKAFQENSVLKIANVYQSLTEWHKFHPD